MLPADIVCDGDTGKHTQHISVRGTTVCGILVALKNVWRARCIQLNLVVPAGITLTNYGYEHHFNRARVPPSPGTGVVVGAFR